MYSCSRAYQRHFYIFSSNNYQWSASESFFSVSFNKISSQCRDVQFLQWRFQHLLLSTSQRSFGSTHFLSSSSTCVVSSWFRLLWTFTACFSVIFCLPHTFFILLWCLDLAYVDLAPRSKEGILIGLPSEFHPGSMVTMEGIPKVSRYMYLWSLTAVMFSGSKLVRSFDISVA